MKIRTQFIIIMVLFAVIVASVAASVVIADQQAGQLNQQAGIARRIEQGASDLSYLSNDYIIYRESQQRVRWEARFSSLSEDLAKLAPDRPEELALVNNIKTNQERLKAVFNDVVLSAESSRQGQPVPADPAFIQVSWSRMAMPTQGIVFDATRLSQMLSDRADQVQRADIILIFALTAIFGAYLVANYVLVLRRTFSSISRLQDGTRVVASGNLDFRLQAGGKDEIGELSRSFNQMTANLKNVTASKTDLEKEIADRKQAEETLRQSEEKYRNVVETSQEGIAIANPDGVVIFVNQRMADMLGYASGDLLGKTFWDLQDDDRKGAGTQPRDELRKGKRLHAEYKFRRKDGTLLWTLGSSSPLYNGAGQHVGNLAMHTDITDRKKAEAEVAHLASFPELNPNPVLELDSTGKLIYANPASRELFPDLLTRGTAHPFLKDWQTVARTMLGEKTRVVAREIEVGGVWYDQTVTHIPSLQKFRLYCRDITQRKQAEESLRHYTANLEAANKEMESFSYSVSHDLRAPLRHIQGFSQAVVEDYADKLDEQGKDFLYRIQRSTEAMGELIDGILSLSRITRQSMGMQVVDLSEMAKDVAAQLKGPEPQRMGEFVITAGVRAKGDARLLRVVLENLLGNAWKFTSKKENAKIEFGSLLHEGRTTYFVRDNGAGFEMSYAAKLFQPFQRLHTADDFTGTGIGLATVQRIVHRHGGRIWAEGESGKGATFYFTLS